MLTGRAIADLLPEATIDLPAQVPHLVRKFPVTLSAHSVEMLSAALAFDPARRPHVASVFALPLVNDLDSPLDRNQTRL